VSKKNDHPFARLKELKLASAEPKKAPPPKAKAPKSTPEEEAQAFQRMMSGVTPMGQEKARIPTTETHREASPAKRAALHARETVDQDSEEARLRLDALVDPRFEVQDDGRHAEGRRADVSADVVRRLRRGQFPIDGRLDLHGMRAEDARSAVEKFLREMRARRERCVLIVHGKGLHSPGGEGVLRGELSAWLSEGRASSSVDAFASAHAEDGGEGATYVLLRK